MGSVWVWIWALIQVRVWFGFGLGLGGVDWDSGGGNMAGRLVRGKHALVAWLGQVSLV